MYVGGTSVTKLLQRWHPEAIQLNLIVSLSKALLMLAPGQMARSIDQHFEFADLSGSHKYFEYDARLLISGSQKI